MSIDLESPYSGEGSILETLGKTFRKSAVTFLVPCITTMSGARAAADAVAAKLRDPIRVWSLQEIHEPKKTLA